MIVWSAARGLKQAEQTAEKHRTMLAVANLHEELS
jgi:hypothetical protein